MIREEKLVTIKSLSFSLLSVTLFMITGIFWAFVVILQGDLLLIWPSLTCFFSAGLIFFKRSAVFPRRLALATCLYNFIIFSYLAYSAFYLLGSSFASFAFAAFLSYIIYAIIFLFVMLRYYGESNVLPFSSRFSQYSESCIQK